MPFRMSLADGIISTNFHGVVTAGDLAEFAAEFIALENLQSTSPSRVTDLSETAAMDINFADVAALAERRRAQKFSRTFRSAIIATTPVQFGLARMFQILNDHPQIEIRVFQVPAEAWAWVRAAAESATSA